MRMPFGKFKGLQVSDLPDWYLSWLWQRVDLREPLRSEVLNSLVGATDRRTLITLDRVKSAYRSLALKWHPDRGGSNQAMAALNEFYEKLTTEMST